MTETDTDFLAAMLGDPEVMRYYPKPLDRSEAEAWLQRVLQSYTRFGHAFRTFGAARVICMIHPENTPSLGVAARLDMRRIGDIIHAGMPHLLFEYRRFAV